jgi:GntR family transcriptional regulator, transcriptional repressor for pyruvate dehydrogenase complex
MSSPAPAIARDLLLSPVAPAGAVEQVVRRIGEAIGAGLLAPGERLPGQIELAETLGVARMTLRQALAVLEDAGLIEIRRGRTGGAFVAPDPPPPALDPPTAEQLRALTDWRRAVSGEAAALAADRRTARDLDALRAAMRAVEDASADAAAFRRADARFHVLVAELSRSGRLVAAEANLQVELAEVLAITPGPARARRVSQAGHEPIVAAIADGDSDAARAATIRHVEATHDWVRGLARGLRRRRPVAR